MIARHGRLLALALSVGCSSSDAQGVAEIPSTPTCPGCRIELTKVATIGGPNDSLLFEPRKSISTLQVDRYGRLLVAFHRGVIAVYDSTGRWLRTVGRVGSGPGEIDDPMTISLSPGDTLYAFTFSRVNVYTPDLKFERKLPYPMLSGGWLLPKGRFLAMGGEPGVHILDQNARTIATIGTRDVGQVSFQNKREQPRFIRGRGETLWSYYPSSYRVAKWSANGKLLVTLSRNTPWFKPWADADFQWFDAIPGRGRYRGYDTPMLPTMDYVHESPTGELWCFVGVPKATWKPIDTAAQRRRGEPLNPHEDGLVGKFHDTMIEILDPSKGTVITAQRFSMRLLSTNRYDYVYTMRTDNAGEDYYDIWRLTLKRPSQH
jgi:hypothetical protein